MERLEAKLQAVGTVPGMKITRWLPKRVKLLRKMSENVAKMMLAFQLLVALSSAAQMHNSSHSGLSRRANKQDNVVAELQVLCHSDAIVLKVNTNTPFNGMLYAKDAPNGHNCFSEFHSSTNMSLRLPLKSCGTLFAELDDGIEYFNTVVVQPHMRLMTNQGKGYHIRCKYQTRERTIANTHFNVSAAFLMQAGPQTATTPLLATASMPSCTMKIFRSGREDVAETVKIGDKLIMVIEIDQQDMYGMKISNCVVRDGMNIAEQQLINEQGCPLDESIMPKFEYSNNFTRAAVSFPAHKFPHTSSVYYQCNVRLCINNGNCDQTDCTNPPNHSNGPASPTNLAPTTLDPLALGASSPTSGASTSRGSSPVVAPPRTSAGGPRRKRFVKHHNQQTLQSRPMGRGSELGAGGGPVDRVSESAGPQEQISFDVYSGIYVSDLDVAQSGSSEPNGRLVEGQTMLEANNNLFDPLDVDRQAYSWLRLNPVRASLLMMLVGGVSVGLLVVLACQLGLVGGQHEFNVDNGNANLSPLEYHLGVPASHNSATLPAGHVPAAMPIGFNRRQ